MTDELAISDVLTDDSKNLCNIYSTDDDEAQNFNLSDSLFYSETEFVDLLTSQKFTAEWEGTDDHAEWVVDMYPKGVWFQRCLTVYRPPGMEVSNYALRHCTRIQWFLQLLNQT